MSLVIDIADAVAGELNTAGAGSFSLEFTALRRALPVYDLAELTDLKISVVPKALEIAGATRGLGKFDVQVDIGIQQKLPPGEDVDSFVESLCGLVDEIVDFLRQKTLADAPWASWVATENDPVYVPEHLADRRVFTAVLTLTYRAMK